MITKPHGRINHLVGHTHSITPGPTGKLDAKVGYRGGSLWGPSPQPTRGVGNVGL